MENRSDPSQETPPPEAAQEMPALPAGKTASEPAERQDLTPQQKRALIIGIVAVVLIFVLLIASVIFLLRAPAETTAQIRDVFLIFMALESLFLGLAMVILMIQLARLINLLQNEIKPILDSTNETVSHLRGTTVFLSENLVGPVIKLNEYLAGLSQFFQVIGLVRKSSKPKTPPKGE
ncbi:MAG: hypothetical protein JXB15_05725 [Anaerolineales bacterium]|nr:hypothetical protein [Anaerolineales bacterium]